MGRVKWGYGWISLILILDLPSSTDALSSEERQSLKRFKLSLFSRKPILLGLILLLAYLASLPTPHAQAGVFGTNSQNIGLSSAALPALNSAYSGGGDINISDDALLPDTGVLGTAADISEIKPQSDQISLYVVRSGDSLSGIAEMFGVSVNTIRWANSLSSKAALQVGQTLTILPINGIRHVVQKGETLESIAKKYKGDAEEIANFNEIATLTAGSEIMIPGGEEPASAEAPAGKPVRGSSGPNYAGYYAKPLANYVRTQGIHGNNGVDLATRLGAPVMAAASGKVIVALTGGWNGGYGNYVVVSHPNGTQTLYGHLLDVTTTVGASVAQGEVIGHLGNTGKSTGPHLHFEVRGAKNPF